jgi:hypothetical protein
VRKKKAQAMLKRGLRLYEHTLSSVRSPATPDAQLSGPAPSSSSSSSSNARTKAARAPSERRAPAEGEPRRGCGREGDGGSTLQRRQRWKKKPRGGSCRKGLTQLFT